MLLTLYPFLQPAFQFPGTAHSWQIPTYNSNARQVRVVLGYTGQRIN